MSAIEVVVSWRGASDATRTLASSCSAGGNQVRARSHAPQVQACSRTLRFIAVLHACPMRHFYRTVILVAAQLHGYEVLSLSISCPCSKSRRKRGAQPCWHCSRLLHRGSKVYPFHPSPPPSSFTLYHLLYMLMVSFRNNSNIRFVCALKCLSTILVAASTRYFIPLHLPALPF